MQLRIHMPYSWWRPGMPRPTKAGLPLYLQALGRELSSLGEDLPEARLDSVVFVGGYLGLLLPDEYTAFLQHIHRCFATEKELRVSGVLFPGSIDMALMSSYKNTQAGPLFLEVPSLLMRECERLQLPNVLQLLDHGKYLFANYQFPDWGLFLPTVAPRKEAEWERVGQEILRYAPAHVWFTPAFAPCEALLQKAGYRLLSPGFYTRAAEPPTFLFQEEYLGAGLGAVTRLQGFETENTKDLGRYLNSSGNYRNLLVRVEELS